MKIYKGAYSEYAIAAFIQAAELGYPSPEAVKRIPALEKSVREDLNAVHHTFEDLYRSEAGEVVRAVMAVYRPCREGGRHIARTVLRERVLLYSLGRAYSEETVYRMLSRARRVFAEKRGLTVE